MSWETKVALGILTVAKWLKIDPCVAFQVTLWNIELMGSYVMGTGLGEQGEGESWTDGGRE